MPNIIELMIITLNINQEWSYANTSESLLYMCSYPPQHFFSRITQLIALLLPMINIMWSYMKEESFLMNH